MFTRSLYTPVRISKGSGLSHEESNRAGTGLRKQIVSGITADDADRPEIHKGKRPYPRNSRNLRFISWLWLCEDYPIAVFGSGLSGLGVPISCSMAVGCTTSTTSTGLPPCRSPAGVCQ